MKPHVCVLKDALSYVNMITVYKYKESVDRHILMISSFSVLKKHLQRWCIPWHIEISLVDY